MTPSGTNSILEALPVIATEGANYPGSTVNQVPATFAEPLATAMSTVFQGRVDAETPTRHATSSAVGLQRPSNPLPAIGHLLPVDVVPEGSEAPVDAPEPLEAQAGASRPRPPRPEAEPGAAFPIQLATTTDLTGARLAVGGALEASADFRGAVPARRVGDSAPSEMTLDEPAGLSHPELPLRTGPAMTNLPARGNPAASDLPARPAAVSNEASPGGLALAPRPAPKPDFAAPISVPSTSAFSESVPSTPAFAEFVSLDSAESVGEVVRGLQVQVPQRPSTSEPLPVAKGVVEGAPIQSRATTQWEAELSAGRLAEPPRAALRGATELPLPAGRTHDGALPLPSAPNSPGQGSVSLQPGGMPYQGNPASPLTAEPADGAIAAPVRHAPGFVEPGANAATSPDYNERVSTNANPAFETIRQAPAGPNPTSHGFNQQSGIALDPIAQRPTAVAAAVRATRSANEKPISPDTADLLPTGTRELQSLTPASPGALEKPVLGELLMDPGTDHLDGSGAEEIVEKTIVRQLTWMSRSGVSEAHLKLDPQDLGSLDIRVSVRDDQATVSFVATEPTVRDALQEQTERLRELLGERGMALADSSVRNGFGAGGGESSNQRREQRESDASDTGDSVPEGSVDDRARPGTSIDAYA